MDPAPSSGVTPEDLDSHSLRVVRAVADHGSVTAAAAALGYSQPAVSQAVRRLESRIGMAVLARAGRGVRLTEAGRVVARHATVVLRSIDAAADELTELAGARAGQARLTGFPSASSTLVPSVLGAMATRSPGVRTSYLEAEPPEAVAAVRDGVADVALTFSYPGDPQDPHGDSTSGLTSVALWRDTMLLVLPTSHGLARGPATREVAVGYLAQDRWIGGCPRCRAHLLATCGAAGFVPSIAYETDNVPAVLGMVAAGLGVAMLPSLAVTGAPLPSGVVARRPAGGDHRTVHLVLPPEAEAMPAVLAMRDAVRSLDPRRWGLHAV
jgi:DNA-binding transcriptional LysR family regulator